MAYIRIPTGVKMVTATATRKGFILYKCTECGHWVLYEHTLKAQSSGNYHAFQSKTTKNRVEDKATRQASDALERQDAALYAGINEQNNYECVNFRVTCPRCHKIQPWSNVPRRWTKSPLFIVWIIALVFFAIFSLVMATSLPQVSVCFAIETVLIAILPLFRNLRRKRKIKKIQELDFYPPVYYNKNNLEELISWQASELQKNSVENGSR